MTWLWIRGGSWSHEAGRWFVYDRIYRRGRRTPLVRVRWRHGFMRPNW